MVQQGIYLKQLIPNLDVEVSQKLSNSKSSNVDVKTWKELQEHYIKQL